MKQIPSITVQMVHIQGPMQGEIQDFNISKILIGRHPDCNLKFPKDLTMISRKHATITRDGNRFKLQDTSTNGIFLNGKRITEAYLKDGDVLMFTQGGPKVSFLTRVEQPDENSAAALQAEPLFQKKSLDTQPSVQTSPEKPQAKPFAPPPDPTGADAKIKVPLVIQYGPTLRSFHELPVILGKGPECDFIIDHPGILDQHTRIFFAQDQYWAADLTGQRQMSVNNVPVDLQTVLKPDDELALSDQGPKFRFLGGGRLAEIETPPDSKSPDPDPNDKTPPKNQPQSPAVPSRPETSPTKSGSIFNKFFK